MGVSQTAILQVDCGVSQSDLGAGCKRRLSTAFDQAGVGLACVSPDGHWLEINQRLCSILGLSSQELAHRSFKSIAYPDSPEADLQSIRAVLAGDIDTCSWEKGYVRADGSSVWCNLTISVVRTAEGKPDYFVISVKDASDRRTAEDQLRELQQTFEARVAERTAVLSASEARYRLLAEGANEMIARMAPDGTVLFVTPAVERILGYAPKEVVGKNTLSFTHPGDVPVTLAVFAGLIAGEAEASAVPYQFRARRKDGSWVWLEGQPCVEFDENGRPAAFRDVVRDITARKNVEEELRRSQAFLARTSAAAGVGGWEVDAATREVLWSDQTCLIHEVEPGFRPTLEDAIAFYEPKARPIIKAAVEHALATGLGWDLELPVVTARGRKFWARAVGMVDLENGLVVRLTGAFQDITERRQMVQELAEQREQMRVTLQSIGDAVVTTDASGTVLWLNPEAERLVERRGEQAVARPVHHVMETMKHGSRRPIPFPCAEDKPCALSKDTVLVGASGSERDIEGTVAPVLDSSQGCLGHVIVFRDVSDARRRERDLEYQAIRDPLTGLLNRRGFEDLLQRRLTANGRSAALLAIDLDGFKQVNDTLGHAVGDRVLRQVASLLRKDMRLPEVECVGRLGGDEFAVLLDCDTCEEALRAADRLCAGVARFHFNREAGSFGIGASIGVVMMTGSPVTVAGLLEAADQTCYRAKHAGKGRAMLGLVSVVDEAVAIEGDV